MLNITEGSHVTIKRGPLRGFTGVVQPFTRSGQFVIRVDCLPKCATVEVDVAILRLTPKSAIVVL
jgi:transcription antitermination factor NusG